MIAAALAIAAQDGDFVETLTDHLVKFKMVRLPDGKLEHEGRTVEVKGLWAGETEVPFELFEVWALRLDLSQSQQAAGVDAASRPSKPYGAIFINFGHHGYPAICVTLESATGFCRWLSEKTGRTYRLPTSAEWEYAARAGSTDTPEVQAVGWVWENAFDATHKIGTKPANAWGLRDTLGNAAEWCLGADGTALVAGGSWKDKAATVSASRREAQTPKWNESDPQSPKSRWWLANGQFVGLRLFCEGPGKMGSR